MTRRKTNLSMNACLCLLVALFIASCGDSKKSEPSKQDKQDKQEVSKDTSKDASKQPKIVAVNPVFEFGKVKQGEVIEHVFKIRNEGNADLKLEKAKGS